MASPWGVEIARKGDAVTVPEAHFPVFDLVAFREGLVPSLFQFHLFAFLEDSCARTAVAVRRRISGKGRHAQKNSRRQFPADVHGGLQFSEQSDVSIHSRPRPPADSASRRSLVLFDSAECFDGERLSRNLGWREGEWIFPMFLCVSGADGYGKYLYQI